MYFTATLPVYPCFIAPNEITPDFIVTAIQDLPPVAALPSVTLASHHMVLTPVTLNRFAPGLT